MSAPGRLDLARSQTHTPFSTSATFNTRPPPSSSSSRMVSASPGPAPLPAPLMSPTGATWASPTSPTSPISLFPPPNLPGGTSSSLPNSSSIPPPPSSSGMPSSSGKILPAIPSPLPHSASDKKDKASADDDKSAHPLMKHLQDAFLTGMCSDVTVRIAQWGLEYRLHRVVLVQAGFFHSLFLGGFSEGEPSTITSTSGNGTTSTLVQPTRKASGSGIGAGPTLDGSVLRLSFDDLNITRAAFEIFISRLYSRKPDLYVSPALLPTHAHPLTPSFPAPPLLSAIHPPHSSLAPNTQPASPRLLLSLLATSIYLGQNDVVRESLGLVLGSVTPWSVGRYLGFAIGRGCGPEEIEGEDLVAARGMESLGRVYAPPAGDGGKGREGKGKGKGAVKDEPTEEDLKPPASALHAHRNSEDMDDAKVCEVRTPSQEIPSPMDQDLSPRETSFSSVDLAGHGRGFFYGFAGDRLGEAAVAWLARWGQDLLEVEEAQFEALMKERERERSGRGSSPFTEGFSKLGLSGAGGEGRSASGSRDRRSRSISFQLPPDGIGANGRPSIFSSSPVGRGFVDAGNARTAPRLCVWGAGGLPGAWVRAIVSSDEFFIDNEMERYRFAKRVIDLRRAGKEDETRRRSKDSELAVKEEDEDRMHMEMDGEEDEEEAEDEAEMQEIFSSGIHFSHMQFEELSLIQNDINPDTGHPYVPQIALQAALWANSDLKTKITGYRNDGTYAAPTMGSPLNRTLSGSRTPTQAQSHSAEHGLAMTTAEIVQAVELASKPITPKWNNMDRATSASPGKLPNLGRDAGNTSGMSSPSGTPRSSSRHLSFGNSYPYASAADRLWWPVPVDNTIRIGDAASQAATFTPFHALPDLGPNSSSQSKAGRPDSQRFSTGEANFFGFAQSVRSGKEILDLYDLGLSAETKAEALWSRYEPFRFSVEFWNVEALGEKERAYSKTVFHAGSYFNIYVQTLRKSKDKGVQLGIYLHRQSMLEPLPNPSRANDSVSRSVSPLGWNASSPAVHSISSPTTGDNPLAMQRTMSIPATTTAMVSTSPGALSAGNDEDADDLPSPRVVPNKNAPLSPYRDPRKTAKVYFSVSCASAMGTALTRFSSGPDNFAVSQSWGWRSSSLRSQEYLSCGAADVAGPTMNERLESGVLGWVSDVYDEWPKKSLQSLRASVVLGVL